MTEHDVKEKIVCTIDTCFSDLQGDPWLAQRIRSGATEERKVKKKLSMGMLIAIIATLAIAGALAAAIHWNVMDFLFGEQKPQLEYFVKNIEEQTSDGQVTLTVNSALCDGEMLALDWTVCNEQPDKPVFLQIDNFSANGIRLWSDGTDSFDQQWLPGWCNDGAMQDGENLSLPDEITGDVLTVDLTVGVYRPKKPVYLMETYDEQEAAKKLAEGYYILAEGEGFVVPDPDTGGLMHCFGSILETDLPNYDRTELTVAFELDLAAARAACRTLETPSAYEWNGLTVRYTKALLTPVALYLTLEASGGDEAQYDALILDGQFKLTDGDGNTFEQPWCQYETGKEMLPDGTLVLRSTQQYVGISTDALPETLSLSYVRRDGSMQQTFPFALAQE